VSYILDALKKAAEQRTGPAVEMRRLLAPPQISATSIPRYVTLAVAGVALLGAAVIFWVWVPSSDFTAGPAAPVPSVVGAPIAANAPAVSLRDERLRGAANDQPRPSLSATEPTDDARRTTAGDTHRAVAKPRASDAPRVPDAPRVVTDARPVDAPRVADARPLRTMPAAPITAAPAPGIAAVPSTPSPTTARADTNKLKVEVIVYADQPTQRWAFINGRKYVEGDVIGDGGRVEEIQSAGVVIVEDGRRVTLRP
jgi:general secretion pathway protein B